MRISRIFSGGIVLAAAILCCAAGPGIFESDSGVSETDKKGGVEFRATTGEYRVSGAGGDIWGKTDGFHYVWKKISGDMAVTADAQFVGAGAMSHRKAALMIRQSLDPDSAYADAVVHGDGLTSLQFRPATGEMSKDVRVIAKSDLSAPVRLRIERRGDMVTVLAGKPGDTLTSSVPSPIVFQGPVYVGLAVSSHNPAVAETVVFTNVTIEKLAATKP
jgi:TolB protein